MFKRHLLRLSNDVVFDHYFLHLNHHSTEHTYSPGFEDLLLELDESGSHGVSAFRHDPYDESQPLIYCITGRYVGMDLLPERFVVTFDTDKLLTNTELKTFFTTTITKSIYDQPTKELSDFLTLIGVENFHAFDGYVVNGNSFTVLDVQGLH